MITRKVDFMLTFEVECANPNGDPLSGNMPRTNSEGYGLVSDVAIKRKIRNRLQDEGYQIFVQANERIHDGHTSLQKRFESKFKDEKDEAAIVKQANQEWIDVRAFGQVFTYCDKAIGVRGPLSISMAKSLNPIVTSTMQITRSTNGKEQKLGNKGSDTMGSKHYVEYGVYLVKGSVNVFFSEKTGFSDKDLNAVKLAIKTLFENDASTARPESSMRVKELFWFTHPDKLGVVSSARIYDLLEWNSDGTNKHYNDYNIHLNKDELMKYQEKGLEVEIIEGD